MLDKKVKGYLKKVLGVHLEQLPNYEATKRDCNNKNDTYWSEDDINTINSTSSLIHPETVIMPVDDGRLKLKRKGFKGEVQENQFCVYEIKGSIFSSFS